MLKNIYIYINILTLYIYIHIYIYTYIYNPAILKYISRHCIDQLHSTHHPDYTMLYNLTSSATEVPTSHSSNTNLV